MSSDQEKANRQHGPKNGLIVGLIAGAGFGMVFGTVLFGESRTGYVYGSMLGAVLGLGFSFVFTGHAAERSDADGPGE